MAERNAGAYKNKKNSNSERLVIRDEEIFVSEDSPLPYTTQHTQHQGMLFPFSLMHAGTSVTKPEGLQSLCLFMSVKMTDTQSP